MIDTKPVDDQDAPAARPIQPTVPHDHDAESVLLARTLSKPVQSDVTPVPEQAGHDQSEESSDDQPAHTSSDLHTEEIDGNSAVQTTHTTTPSTTTPHDAVSRRADDDFNWLMSLLWNRVTALKRYPQEARMNRWEGRVIVRVIIDERGHLLDAVVAAGSGHEVLDRAALEVIRESCPLALTQPLGRSRIVLRVPIQYKLNS